MALTVVQHSCAVLMSSSCHDDLSSITMNELGMMLI